MIPIYNDHQLSVLVEAIKDQYDRRVSVPVLRDIVAAIENDIVKRLKKPGAVVCLGEHVRIEVHELMLPPDTEPEIDQEREFCLLAFASDDLLQAIRTTAMAKAFDVFSFPLPSIPRMKDHD